MSSPAAAMARRRGARGMAVVSDAEPKREQELRTQYNLGYVSDKPVAISEFRTIHLTARQKDLVVQARQKYWAQR